MKQISTRLILLWHVFLVLIVVLAFRAYAKVQLLSVPISESTTYVIQTNGVITGISTQRPGMDEGIPLIELSNMIREIAQKEKGCKVLSVQKDWVEVKIKLACITKESRRITAYRHNDDGNWGSASSLKDSVEGIIPEELIKILHVIQSQPDHVEKRVLYIVVRGGQVVVTTGRSNNSLGGSGDRFIFENKQGEWVLTQTGSWIS